MVLCFLWFSVCFRNLNDIRINGRKAFVRTKENISHGTEAWWSICFPNSLFRKLQQRSLSLRVLPKWKNLPRRTFPNSVNGWMTIWKRKKPLEALALPPEDKWVMDGVVRKCWEGVTQGEVHCRRCMAEEMEYRTCHSCWMRMEGYVEFRPGKRCYMKGKEARRKGKCPRL